MVRLRATPFEPLRDGLRQRIIELVEAELSRDPELEEVLGESRILDLIERMLCQALPWYGGILSIKNTALTGFTTALFLSDGEGSDRIFRAADAILEAVAVLPAHLLALQRHFVGIRQARFAGTVSVGGVEGVLDEVIETTACRPGWQRTLLAAFQWMHEICRVPLPEQRRAAMADWLAQTCFDGFQPEAVTRAEILTALARSMSRQVR